MTSAPSTRPIRSTRLKIGMEIHVELATRSKMFTRAANVAHPDHYDAPANSLVDALVLALPGTLPVMNHRAIELAMMVGMALDCTIPDACKWDRKQYFYPDLPKGYQIRQYDQPLCGGGHLDFEVDDAPGERGGRGGMKRVRIIRAHLEEDAGKLGHELPGGFPYDGSLIDLNRAGTPLLEIVTHPDIESAEHAVSFAKELHNICRCLGVTEGVMQRGHMRFEPNINVIITTDDGVDHATPIVEIKTLNSFKARGGAIDHEHKRQVEQWNADGVEHEPGRKSTRGWDADREVTFLQREKEEAHDYRYFPDPDLLPVMIDDAWRDRVRREIPELPMRRRKRYADVYGLAAVQARTLTDDRDLCLFYEACVHAAAATSVRHDEAAAGRAVAKLLLNVGAKRANERGVAVHELGIAPTQVAQLLTLREENRIGSNAAEQLFGLLCESDDDAISLSQRHNLLQVSDAGALDEWVSRAIAAQPQAANDFAAGKDAALGRLVGEVMKASGGQADAKAVQAKLREKLRAR